MLTIALTMISLRKNTLKVNVEHFKETEVEKNFRIKALEMENAKSKKTIARYKLAREQEQDGDRGEDG